MKKRLELTGSLAVVTGGAGGIGFCFARQLYDMGCSLLLIDISEERLQSACKALSESNKTSAYNQSVHSLCLDLTAPDMIERLDDFCKKELLEPDILINNAGIFSFKPVTSHSDKHLETFIDLHVRAVVMLSKWFCALRTPYHSGRLLNMSSMSCWMPMPGIALYSSTKAFIRVFTRALHYEMKDNGVNVMVACPGGIATDLFGLPANLKKLAVSLGVLDTPEKFAKKAVKKLLKGKKQYINGWLNRFSIFFVSIMPTPVRMLVKRKLLDKGIVR